MAQLMPQQLKRLMKKVVVYVLDGKPELAFCDATFKTPMANMVGHDGERFSVPLDTIQREATRAEVVRYWLLRGEHKNAVCNN